MAENKGLKTEIATIVTKACIHFEHGDEEYTYGAIRQILSKIREVVEGAGLAKQRCEDIYENPPTSIYGEFHTHGEALEHIAQAQLQAILKALDNGGK